MSVRDILFKIHWEDERMGLFSNQLSNVVEWEEYRDDVLFWKWKNDEIKKGSKLIIRQGQDAIFMFNGKVEGTCTSHFSNHLATHHLFPNFRVIAL